MGQFLRAAWLPLLFIFVGMVVLAIAGPIAKNIPLYSTVAIGAITVPALIGLTFLFAIWGNCPDALSALRPDKKTIVRLSVGALIGLGLVIANTSLIALGGHVHWVWSSNISGVGALVAIIGFVLLASREEIAFRGFPLLKIAGDANPWVAQIFVAALFAAEHILGGTRWDQAIIGAGFGSLLFGMAALRTKGLALPIGIHAAWNIGDWARGGKPQGGFWHAIVDPGYEHRTAITGMTSYAVLMVLAIISLALYRRISTPFGTAFIEGNNGK
jgi:membrane protease YdiL (CAAX protease family)